LENTEIYIKIHYTSKITVMKQITATKQFYGGGHHSIRNCIKGHTIRKAESHRSKCFHFNWQDSKLKQRIIGTLTEPEQKLRLFRGPWR
jgi:anaerobic ribonucleoside-triphosphate reductase